MNILLVLAIGLFFILASLLIARGIGIGISGKLVKPLLYMPLKAGTLAYIVYWLLQWNNVWLDGLFLILLVAAAVFSVLISSRLLTRNSMLPVATGLLVSLVLTGGCMLLLHIVSYGTFSSRYMLPTAAILMSCTSESLAKSLAMYYAGLRNHSQLFHYLLASGATRREALRYLARRAVALSLTQSARSMSMVGIIGSGTVLMWSLIAGGMNVIDALSLQVLLVLGVMCSSIVALVVTMAVARRYSLDDYGRNA